MNETNKLSTAPDETLWWRAFQYAHGELSIDDNELFERQMLEDADLCAMVAEASVLTSTIASLNSPVPNLPPARRRVPKANDAKKTVAVITSLCCCVSLLLLLSLTAMNRSSELSVEAPMIDAELLVSVWADDIEEADDMEVALTEDSELDIPDWMIAGISDLNSQNSDKTVDPNSPDHNPEVL